MSARILTAHLLSTSASNNEIVQNQRSHYVHSHLRLKQRRAMRRYLADDWIVCQQHR